MAVCIVFYIDIDEYQTLFQPLIHFGSVRLILAFTINEFIFKSMPENATDTHAKFSVHEVQEVGRRTFFVTDSLKFSQSNRIQMR